MPPLLRRLGGLRKVSCSCASDRGCVCGNGRLVVTALALGKKPLHVVRSGEWKIAERCCRDAYCSRHPSKARIHCPGVQQTADHLDTEKLFLRWVGNDDNCVVFSNETAAADDRCLFD